MNRSINLRVCMFESACIGRLAVANNTRSFTLKTSVFFLPLLSACSFCLSTAAARLSRTYCKVICLCSTKSLIDFCSRFELFDSSGNSSKLAGKACTVDKST
jgi:hypothetical protein